MRFRLLFVRYEPSSNIKKGPVPALRFLMNIFAALWGQKRDSFLARMTSDPVMYWSFFALFNRTLIWSECNFTSRMVRVLDLSKLLLDLETNSLARNSPKKEKVTAHQSMQRSCWQGIVEMWDLSKSSCLCSIGNLVKAFFRVQRKRLIPSKRRFSVNMFLIVFGGKCFLKKCLIAAT